jgi:hypothetical protein
MYHPEYRTETCEMLYPRNNSVLYKPKVHPNNTQKFSPHLTKNTESNKSMLFIDTRIHC